ncbi:MAG: CoA activase [Actinobacteria bacterium]|nr:CoA activase [Actinomycetota bacterium]
MISQTQTPDTSGELYIGFDIGSISLNVAVLDSSGTLLEESYTRLHGQPVHVALEVLTELFSRIDSSRVALLAGTGTGGRLVAQLLEVHFVNEIIAQARGIRQIAPQVRTLVEMGGEESKLVFLAPPGGSELIKDFATNTICAAGTGSFLDQQANRLGVKIEGEFEALALQSKNPPRVAGRCSVFAKSDMIHLQQQATPDYDIVAGLCLGLARNFKSNVGRGKEFIRPIAFCGGVASNKGVVRAFENVLQLQKGELIVPDCHKSTGAMGAVLTALESSATWPGRFTAEKLKEHLANRGQTGERLAKLSISKPSDDGQSNRALRELTAEDTDVSVYLGVDVGSISTNVVAIDEDSRVLAKSYLMTAGRPIEAVRQGLRDVGRILKDKVIVKGVATTGSGRYLTGDFVGADLVVNEITAQATAAAAIDPEVDTIFEIGGQDSKFISLDNGVVVDFEMNHACAAGTGSFLEEQAERLDISIKQQFGRLALDSDSPVKLGERCTVFMESNMIRYQQQNVEVKDLVAGLSYSIVYNYLNRVVGARRIGQRIFFQGGTAFNKGVVAAFSAVTGRPVTVPQHHEVTGAIGVARLAKKHMADHPEIEHTKFRGFDNIDQRSYSVESFECTHCANNCEIKQVSIQGSEPLFYGSRCDRYNVQKGAGLGEDLPDLFDERQKLLEKFAGLSEKSQSSRGTVGIPLALSNYQLFPFWGRMFRSLGFEVVSSGKSTKKVIRRGVETVLSQPCFPVKVAHGHIDKLIEQKVDYLWLPSVVSMPAEDKRQTRNVLCPYVQTIPYQAKVALTPEQRGVKLLQTPVRFQDGRRLLEKDLSVLCSQLGVTRKQLSQAISDAEKAQKDFEYTCRKRGQEVLHSLKPDQRTVVLVSRPYNGCDPSVSLNVPAKLRKMGVLTIPLDMLDLRGVLPEEWHSMYWKYGQRILAGAEVIREDHRLYAIYLTNFSCGPDSFLNTFFKHAIGNKPFLTLEIDEHSADAGVVTRLEAYLESLRNIERLHPGESGTTILRESQSKPDHSQRTVYVPPMGDHAHAMAAAFRRCGQPAEVLPMADAESLALGRRHTTGKECLPCTVTAGDMLRVVLAKDFDPQRTAFFMPSGCGPCRFGNYNKLHKLILADVGFADVPIIAPNQDKDFYKDFKQFSQDPTKLAWRGIAAVDLLTKAQLSLRPYELEPGSVDEVYQLCLQRVCTAIENGQNLQQVMDFCGRQFEQIAVDRSQPKPWIGVVGEIYVRSHTFSNQNIIRQLEALGAEVSLCGFAEWLYYTNFTRSRISLRERDLTAFLAQRFKNHLQHRIEQNYARSFVRQFGQLAEENVTKTLRSAAPYMHDSFEGEAVLSIGKTVEFAHAGADGVVNVMPFTCMPSTIVSSLMKKIQKDLQGMPALSISYDGQEQATTQTRLEAFVYQARVFQQRRDRHKGKAAARDVLAPTTAK